MGVLVPIVDESGWSIGLRATLYFIALLYTFLGAAVVSEYVMASASIITSMTKRIYLSQTPGAGPHVEKGGLDVIEVRVWHDTFINLALMGVITSATEIFISTSEIIVSNFHHTELGPAVIVGSAAFNMLVVKAICMVSPPGSETRKIEDLQVYYGSTIFSLVGYIWIVVLLNHSTPEVIHLWEPLVTVLMYPLFIFLVWLSHRDWLGCCAKVFCRKKPKIQHHKSVDEKAKLDEDLLKDGQLDREHLARLVHKLKRHSGLTDHDAATVAAFKLLQNQPHSTIWYRIGGIRSLTAGYRNMPGLESRLRRAYREICENDVGEGFEGVRSIGSTMGSANRSTPQSHVGSMQQSTGGTTIISSFHHPNASIVEFHSAIVAVERSVGNIEVIVSRHGNLEVQAKVRLTTVDGTAKKNRDYLPIDQILVFDSGQQEAYVHVVIVNISGWFQDEEFFLRLSLIHASHEYVELGRLHIMAVTLIDSNKESIISFEKRGQIVKESSEQVTVMVNRHEGAAGLVSVRWRTVDKTAVAGKDYIASVGELIFNTGEMSLYLEVPIINHMAEHKDIYFEVELYGPTGGARLGRINRCTITITNDEDLHSLIGTMASITTLNLDAIRVKKSTWAQQMRDALVVDGGDVDRANKLDYVAHFFSFLWKALFSLIPPPSMLGGWPCFLVSLICLGFITLLITDLAITFGCLIDVNETLTGISIVALGTNLPEILCARKETRMEKTADASMIGTAAKIAANMMLGLGLPWLMVVIYHQARGMEFTIKDPDIGKNMMAFMACAFLGQSLLIVRRLTPFLGKAEIGGPPIWKWTTFAILIFLWLSYLTLAHYWMQGHISPFD